MSALIRVIQRLVGTHADGKPGPATDRAVRAWQAARGIEQDGVFGPLCRAAVRPGDLIKPYEGLSLWAYDDAQDVPLSQRLLKRAGNAWKRRDGSPLRGYATIGWGRLLRAGEWVESCTRDQADVWFEDFLARKLRDVVVRYVPADRDAAFIAAVYSLGYNGGPGAIIRLAGEGFSPEWWSTHLVTTKGVRDAGLVMRREEEAALAYGDAS